MFRYRFTFTCNNADFLMNFSDEDLSHFIYNLIHLYSEDIKYGISKENAKYIICSIENPITEIDYPNELQYILNKNQKLIFYDYSLIKIEYLGSDKNIAKIDFSFKFCKSSDDKNRFYKQLTEIINKDNINHELYVDIIHQLFIMNEYDIQIKNIILLKNCEIQNNILKYTTNIIIELNECYITEFIKYYSNCNVFNNFLYYDFDMRYNIKDINKFYIDDFKINDTLILK